MHTIPLRTGSRLCAILIFLFFPVRSEVVPVNPINARPSTMLIGLFENPGGKWMDSSGVPWNARYCYITKDWVNNWGWGDYDGWFALNYFQECDKYKTVPVIQYYQMNGEPGGGESEFLSKAQNAETMKTYFGDFKILMQRVKEFNKPVYVLLEADGYAYMEIQSNGNPDAKAAVASTGMAELAALPNTVAGWGLAFLAIKKSVGASNAFLGMHMSGWASQKDLFYYSVEDNLQPEIDKVYAFLSPLGLAANVTGLTYDVLVGDPLDRDADYYRLVNNDGGKHWWDTSASAPVNSRSFNRYREWLNLWNVKAKKSWVLWQIPLGNSNHLNVENKGGPREGYKDNRVEYLLGKGGREHVRQFSDAGVIALLFGAGASGVSNYGNDIYTDGQSLVKTGAAAFFAAGGVPLGISRDRFQPFSSGYNAFDIRHCAAGAGVFDLRGCKLGPASINGFGGGPQAQRGGPNKLRTGIFIQQIRNGNRLSRKTYFSGK
jgi:hypothetical protein